MDATLLIPIPTHPVTFAFIENVIDVAEVFHATLITPSGVVNPVELDTTGAVVGTAVVGVDVGTGDEDVLPVEKKFTDAVP